MPENYSKLREFLDINTKRGRWKEVVEMCAEYPEAHELKLTQHEETALHLAVIDNQEEIVERLVKLICRTPHYEKTLAARNERHNNPLHLAAALGSARMCHRIASAHDKLVDERNKDDETPLFLAATKGHKDAFYCLYYFCRGDETRISTNSREKKNGDTILHCAIRNEHFDLAFQFINMHKEAVSWVNEQGLSPLHVLASKPTAFRSGDHIKGWRKIVYHCTIVDELRPQPIETLSKAWTKEMSKAKKIPCSFPDNYETCIEFFLPLRNAIVGAVSILKELLLKNNKKNEDSDDSHESHESSNKFPENYSTCFDFFRFVFNAIIIIFGFGSLGVRKIREKKQKHTRSVQVMEKLLGFLPHHEYGHDGKIPMDSIIQTDKEAGFTRPYTLEDGKVKFSGVKQIKPQDSDSDSEQIKPQDSDSNYVQETEIMLLAAKNGVIEMVRELFEHFPLAVWETRKSDKKNVVLLAAEYRQPEVYRFLLKNKDRLKSLFLAVDNEGNSALHLAATAQKSMLWHVTGALPQMQWEVKWYKFVEESMPLHFFAHRNKKGKTAHTIFHVTHEEMVKTGQVWLTKTAESCSVVATLIVAVAFATATTIPGDRSPSSGAPLLENEKGLFIFAVCSLIAFSLSSTSVITFLAIHTSRFDATNFGSNLPRKLLVGFASLFFSIVFMLVSFCAGHYFLLAPRHRNVAVLLYALTFIPVALIFVISKLPLYFDVLKAILKAVPRRDAKVVLSEPLLTGTSVSKLLGKFEVTLIRKEIKTEGVSLLIFTPTATTEDRHPYPLILLLPGCVESFHSAFLQLIASHGFVVVAPQMQTTTESTSQLKTNWRSSDREMVEAKLSKLCLGGHSEGRETTFSLVLACCDSPSSRPFSEVIGFNPDPGSKFYIPDSQIQTIAPSNVSAAPTFKSEFVISKLCGSVRL